MEQEKLYLDQYLLEDLAEEVNDLKMSNQRKSDAKRFMMFNGNSNQIIEDEIKKSFALENTVRELVSRLVPLNITEKIIKKLSKVYMEPADRSPVSEDVDDQDLINKIEDQCNLDTMQKYGNYYWNLFKRNLQEIYVDDQGCIRTINIPKHKYEVFNIKNKNIWVPDVICKIKHDHKDLKQQVLVWWSDGSHWVTNGHGEIDRKKMAKMENPEGLNGYGTMPFVYNNSDYYSVNPFSDDDLIRYAILIPVLLTDLLYALKYQCFSLIYTIGVDADLPFNPNIVLNLQRDAEGNVPVVDTIQPNVDADKVLNSVKELLSYLLTSKNLASSTISNMTVQNAASGISKILDSAEMIEDRKEQLPWFKYAEKEFFSKLKNNLIPFWLEGNMLNEEISRNFSEDFELNIRFAEPKAIMTNKEKIDESKMLIDAKLSSWTKELRRHNLNLSESALEELKIQILEDQRILRRGTIEEENGEV